jgi:RNA polymerase sigma-70 factor, ECF subfamily
MNHPEEDDGHELLGRLGRGELGALDPLYRRYSPPVYHLLLAQTGDAEAAADLLQETFLALVDRGPRAATIRSPRTYLLAVAHNLAARRHRRRKRETVLVESLASEAPVEAANRLETLHVWRALAQLPAEQAAVVVLKIWHELTFEEIGAALRVSPNTAASRYRYGAEKLRQLLGEEDDV